MSGIILILRVVTGVKDIKVSWAIQISVQYYCSSCARDRWLLVCRALGQPFFRDG